MTAGLPEFVATTPDSSWPWRRIFARDTNRLAALRAGLRERVAMSPLGNGELFTSNLLALFRGFSPIPHPVANLRRARAPQYQKR